MVCHRSYLPTRFSRVDRNGAATASATPPSRNKGFEISRKIRTRAEAGLKTESLKRDKRPRVTKSNIPVGSFKFIQIQQLISRTRLLSLNKMKNKKGCYRGENRAEKKQTHSHTIAHFTYFSLLGVSISLSRQRFSYKFREYCYDIHIHGVYRYREKLHYDYDIYTRSYL